MSQLFCIYLERLANGNIMRAFPFGALKRFIGWLMGMDQEVAQVYLNLDDHIRQNQELVQLADRYLKSSHAVLDLCAALRKCLEPAWESLISMLEKLRMQLDGEECVFGGMNFEKILEDLKGFKEFSNLSSGEFSRIFWSVNASQNCFLTMLHTKRQKLDKKRWLISQCSRASRAIFTVAIVGLLVATSPIALLVTGASANLVLLLDMWSDSLWKLAQKVPKAQKKALHSMLDGTLVTIRNVTNISISVSLLEIEINKILETKEFTTVGEMNKKLEVLLTSIEELGLRTDRCGQDIKQARMVVLQTITKPPNKVKSNRWKKFSSFLTGNLCT